MISVIFQKGYILQTYAASFCSVFTIVIDMMRSRADLTLVSNHVPTLSLTRHRIYFLEEVFNNKPEKYGIYEGGLNQSQFSISVQGIIFCRHIRHHFLSFSQLLLI